MKDAIYEILVICFGIPILIILYILLLLLNFIEATIKTTDEFTQTFKDCIKARKGNGDER